MNDLAEIEEVLAIATSLEDVLAILRRIEKLCSIASKRPDLGASEDLAILRLRAQRRVGQLLIEMTNDGRLIDPERKAEWIAEARRDFLPSKRTPCAICGRFGSLSQAHHIVPLHVQYDRGIRAPDHRHIWLCPNHHAAVHLLISFKTGTQELIGSTRLELITDLGADELKRVLEIFWRMDS